MVTLEQSARRHAVVAGISSVGFYAFYIACWFINSPAHAVPGLLVVAIFVWAFSPRWIEQARDLCADVAAVRTTFDPQSLGSAMRKLAKGALFASNIKFAKFYLPTNPFQVVPRRANATTTVSGGGKKRRWTSADEVRLELLLRADRAEALAAGADPAEFTGKEFRRRWRELGS